MFKLKYLKLLKKNIFYSAPRYIYWKIKKILYIIYGTNLYERKWKNIHKKRDSGWLLECWNSKDNFSRTILMNLFVRYEEFSSILEIGCNCGPNLYRISQKYPNCKIYGVDINEYLIEKGIGMMEREGIHNVNMRAGKASELKVFNDKSIDIVFTDSVLMYIGPDKIYQTITECFRISKKAIILIEWHSDSKNEYFKGYWIRNYKELLSKFIEPQKILITKITSEFRDSEGWRKFGFIIEITL